LIPQALEASEMTLGSFTEPLKSLHSRRSRDSAFQYGVTILRSRSAPHFYPLKRENGQQYRLRGRFLTEYQGLSQTSAYAILYFNPPLGKEVFINTSSLPNFHQANHHGGPQNGTRVKFASEVSLSRPCRYL